MIKKTAVRRLLKAVEQVIPTVILAVGGVLVCMGVGMLSRPAGYIAAGVFALLAGILLIKGDSGDG